MSLGCCIQETTLSLSLSLFVPRLTLSLLFSLLLPLYLLYLCYYYSHIFQPEVQLRRHRLVFGCSVHSGDRKKMTSKNVSEIKEEGKDEKRSFRNLEIGKRHWAKNFPRVFFL